MHPFQIEHLFRKLDLRAARIEQFLPNLSTKDDMKEFDDTLRSLAAFDAAIQQGLERLTVDAHATRAAIEHVMSRLAVIETRLPADVRSTSVTTADLGQELTGEPCRGEE